VFVDFDGTMAPIVADPPSARPHEQAVSALRRLADRWGTVAVVSGRPAAFLAEHLAGAGSTRFLGLYGMEEATGESGRVSTHPEADGWRPAVAAAADEAETRSGPGVAVERKGLTVTLHFRAAPGQAQDVALLARHLAEAHGLAAHPGKLSVELRPPVAVDKGTVVTDLASGLAAVAFAGDDLGDIPAFQALAARRAAGVATLSVAAAGTETPAEVLAAADMVVDGPAGIVEWMEELAGG
jgi:trehalose 6-phosphate phosphatase